MIDNLDVYINDCVLISHTNLKHQEAVAFRITSTDSQSQIILGSSKLNIYDHNIITSFPYAH